MILPELFYISRTLRLCGHSIDGLSVRNNLILKLLPAFKKQYNSRNFNPIFTSILSTALTSFTLYEHYRLVNEEQVGDLMRHQHWRSWGFNIQKNCG